jgi:predicted DNA-binding transcriptional regulator YafY
MVPPSVGRVDDDRDGWCLLTAGGDDPECLAMRVAGMHLDVEVLEPPEVREAAARLSRRLARIAGGA